MGKPKEVDAAPAAQGANVTGEKPSAPATKKLAFYKLGRKLTEDDKLPKQAKVLMDVLAEAGKDGLEREAFAKACEGKIETRQPIARIIGYYQARLETAGLITISKQEVPA